MIYKEDKYVVQTLKQQGNFTIDKVTESNGEIFYDVYDKENNLVNVFKSAKEARAWARIMSK